MAITIPNHPEVHPFFFFLERHQILVQGQGGTYLAFGFPKTSYLWGSLFSNRYSKTLGIVHFPLFWTGWVTCLETSTNRNRSRVQERLTQVLHIGEKIVHARTLWVPATGLLTGLGVAGVHLLWVPGQAPWKLKGSETDKVIPMNHWNRN